MKNSPARGAVLPFLKAKFDPPLLRKTPLGPTDYVWARELPEYVPSALGHKARIDRFYAPTTPMPLEVSHG